MSRIKKFFLFIVVKTVFTVLILSMWKFHEYPSSVGYREERTICHVSYDDARKIEVSEVPIIYFVTPTYPRMEQAPELIRLGQTLMHVPNLHWIVADDSKLCNDMILEQILKFKIPFTYMATPMPSAYLNGKWIPYGVANRRAAISWIRGNILDGVLYFGDDDNTYDLDLFDEIRFTRKLSMFPVGFIGNFSVSSPIVRNGRVIGFYDSWVSIRKFHVDMAGFAINVKYILKNPTATMPYVPGQGEDLLLRSLNLKFSDIEPKANSCTRVLVWHTKTRKNLPTVVRSKYPLEDTNLEYLWQEFKYLGMIQSQ